VSAAESTADLLARLDTFAGLSREELERLADVAVPRSYTAGQVVFREGDDGDTCFVVRDGSLKATRTHSDGRTIALTELRAGDMFGELAMFSGERRSATIEAVEDTTAVALLGADVRRLLAASPEIAVKMLVALAERVRSANDRIASQSFQSVASRVAGVLAAQVQARQNEGAGQSDVVVQMTQADIAELAGTSRESASRFLATLERAGIVELGRGKVVVRDPAALRGYIY
jgi:CRP/FNR family transcriptional regulator, cyclic AMP receptor protein